MNDDALKAGELLILQLLAGFCEDDNGRISVNYKLSPDEERRARAILARQLRDGSLNPAFKELLALAIDPDTPSDRFMYPTRKIKFEATSQGPSATWSRDQIVIYWIKKELHEQPSVQLEAAYAIAASRTGLSRASVQNIWREYQDWLRYHDWLHANQ